MEDCDDMVIGSRYVPGGGIKNWPIHRRLLSSIANSLRTHLVEDSGDETARRAFAATPRKCWWRSTPSRLSASGYSFLEEMARSRVAAPASGSGRFRSSSRIAGRGARRSTRGRSIEQPGTSSRRRCGRERAAGGASPGNDQHLLALKSAALQGLTPRPAVCGPAAGRVELRIARRARCPRGFGLVRGVAGSWNDVALG